MKDIKYGILLLLTNVCLLFCICQLERFVFHVRTENEKVILTLEEGQEFNSTVASGQRVIYYSTLKETERYSEKEYTTLLHIVQAEAGGEDYEGKLLVANVILNRVESDKFPDNIVDVVYQKSGGVTQFQPVSTGSINTVVVSEETKEAVDAALNGEDISNGALFFAARAIADPERMKWFDNHLTYLFTHGGHEFFK